MMDHLIVNLDKVYGFGHNLLLKFVLVKNLVKN
jgi:hypothetical protein